MLFLEVPIISARSIPTDIIAKPARCSDGAVVADQPWPVNIAVIGGRPSMNKPRVPKQHIALIAEKFYRRYIAFSHLEEIGGIYEAR